MSMPKSIDVLYALYEDEDLLLSTIKKLREKKINIQEVYSPFPVHGLDKALGYKETRLSKMAFLYGIFGISFACILTWYMMIRDWPQDIGGKPPYTWYENMPAFVPILFELTVFCTAHFMCLNYLFCSKLYPGAPSQNPDPRTTDDKFLIELHLDPSQRDFAFELLKKNGSVEITQKELIL